MGSLCSEGVADRRRDESRWSGRFRMWSCVAGDASARDGEGCGHARGRDIGARARRGGWIAKRSGSVAGSLQWGVKIGPRHWRRQNRGRGFTGSQCFGRGALRHPGAGQRDGPGFDRGSLHTEAGALIGRRIEPRRGTGLLAFECGRSGNCGRPRPLDFSSYEKYCQENV